MRIFATAVARLLCLGLVAATSSQCRGDETYPYLAYVNDSSAIVRSGPGTDFYATDSLDWADKIEVYQHADSDWAAIRPPSGSFSWVPASALVIAETPDLGVVQSTVKTLIGSRLNDRFDVEYVTMRPGDVVEILGQAHLDLDGNGPVACYKIVPPAGEFRWIRRSQLALQPPVKPTELAAADSTSALVEMSEHDGDVSIDIIRDDDAVSNDNDADQEIALMQFESEAEPGLVLPPASGDKLDEEPLELLEPPKIPSDSAASARDSLGSATRTPPQGSVQLGPITAAPESLGTSAPPTFGLPADGQIVPPPARIGAAAAPTRRMPLGPVGKLRLGQELIDIEMQLTQQVAQPPETWRLDELHSRAQAVIDTSDEVKHRATAQRIIAKIAQLEDVKRRHGVLLDEQDRLASRVNVGNAYAFQADASNATDPYSPSPAVESSYDGMGWLMPVVTDHPSIPRYVLTDAEGNIKQFVSPKPGMNLSRYEQKRIAVYGQKGYLPTYNQPHLMAERIITLDKIR